mgnify:FL=1
MRNVYTVKQVNAYIKNMFTQDFMLNRIYIKGEVSNCKYHTSGHLYFSLKDESGTIACVMFAGQRGGLSFHMREGQQIIVLGSVNVYERTGSYQLYAQEIRLDGEGTLYEKYQMLKQELEEMGMFAPEYKKAIPRYAKRIGVVTAPTGAAVRDIMNISARRNPYVQLLLYPAQVQGEGAKESIVRGIRMLETKNVDVIIVGRGGGSIEDLWAFNDERVARAIYASDIPVISAVGHEPDVTIADFVADARASTPSNAAEIAVPDQREIYRRLDALQMRMVQSEQKRVKALREQFEKTSRSRVLQDPMAFIDDKRMLLDYTQKNLAALAQQQMAQRTQQFTALAAKLDALSPLKVLGRGYAVARNEQGQILRAAQEAAAGEKIEVLLGQGSLNCTVNACNMGGNDDGKNV